MSKWNFWSNFLIKSKVLKKNFTLCSREQTEMSAPGYTERIFLCFAEVLKIIRSPAGYTKVREDPAAVPGQRRNGISSL